ncbi:MAG: hypothetical protein ACLTZU_02765 [Odoribacter splanchnicus]
MIMTVVNRKEVTTLQRHPAYRSSCFYHDPVLRRLG